MLGNQLDLQFNRHIMAQTKCLLQKKGSTLLYPLQKLNLLGENKSKHGSLQGHGKARWGRHAANALSTTSMPALTHSRVRVSWEHQEVKHRRSL